MTPSTATRVTLATLAALAVGAACGRAPSGAAPSEVSAAPPPTTTTTTIATSSSTPAPAAAPAPTTDAAEPALAFAGGDGGPHRRVYRLAAMGDSLTDARSKGGAFLELLRERCPRSTFDNFGVGGQMVNQMAARFGRQILGEPRAGGAPAYTDVLVWGGVNDLYSDETAGRTVSKIQHDLSTMYASARARGLRVLAMTVAPWGGFTRYWSPKRRATTLALNAWLREAPARGDVSGVVDAWALLSCADAGSPDKLCPPFARRDGLHVTTEGQRKLGEELHARYFADCE